jgi:hypothetical protein
MGRGCGASRYAAAQVWHHAEFEGISPGHLMELERMLQRMVEGQPLRPDGSAMGWLQGVPYRLFAGLPAEGDLGLWAPREHQVARVRQVGHQARGRSNCISHVTLFHLHRRLTCRNQRSCLGDASPYILWLIGQYAVMLKPPRRQLAQFQTGLGWHGRCFCEPAIPSIRCKPCCEQRSAYLQLLFLASILINDCPRSAHDCPRWFSTAHADCHCVPRPHTAESWVRLAPAAGGGGTCDQCHYLLSS